MKRTLSEDAWLASIGKHRGVAIRILDVFEEMLDKYHAGADIVYGVRNNRKKDTFFKRTTAQGFYKVMEIMGVKTVYNHADFRLMSQRAVKHFAEFKENLYFFDKILCKIFTFCQLCALISKDSGEPFHTLIEMEG